jgi:hypothetical protein
MKVATGGASLEPLPKKKKLEDEVEEIETSEEAEPEYKLHDAYEDKSDYDSILKMRKVASGGASLMNLPRRRV